jgi:RNA polymerase sigma-70 factor (ECF subfamily)
VRAKTKIRQARIAFEIPGADSLPARLTAVLNAIYAAFGDSWEDADGADAQRAELADEAIWLARLLNNLLPEEPEVRGLLALMLHCEARRPARRSREGRYVPLAEQDCGLWREPLIEEAERQLALASRAARIGRFQLEAAIQSVHAERRRSGNTQWCAIAAFYDRLAILTGAVGVEVGRAAAHAEVEGPEIALCMLDHINKSLSCGYQPYWAVRAHVLDRLGRDASAVAAYTCALDLTSDEAVRSFLLQRRDAAANSGDFLLSKRSAR